MTKPKYKITEPEGIELFLQPARHQLPEKSAPADRIVRPLRLSIKAALSVLLFLLLTGSLFMVKSYIAETRASSQEYALISRQIARLTAEMNLDNSSAYSTEQKRELADSLILELNRFLYQHPDKTAEYAAVWPKTVMYRYLLEWYSDSYFNLENQAQVNKMDLVLEQKVALLNPDLAEILTLLYDLHDYYYFKCLYPLPPENTVKPVEEALVQRLITKGENINRIFARQSALLNINFRAVGNQTRIVLNSYYPEVKQWSLFWQKYNQAINADDSLKTARILTELQQKFPYISLPDKNRSSNLSAVRNLNWGFLPDEFSYLASGAQEQFKDLLTHLTKNSGHTMVLKEYISYELLKRDFLDGKLDFCFIGHERIYNFAENNQALPLAFRLYHQQNLTGYYLYSSTGKNDLKNLQSRKLFVDGTVFSNIFFETIEFFSKQGMNPAQLFAEMEIRPEKSGAQPGTLPADFDLLVACAEKYDKLTNNRQKNKAVQLIKESPSDLIFANSRTLDSLIAQEITSALIRLKDGTATGFADFDSWGRFDRQLFNTYAQTEKLDQPRPTNPVVVNYSSNQNQMNQKLAGKFIRALFNYGYAVIGSEYFNGFCQSVQMPPVKKINLRQLQDENGRTGLQIEMLNGIHPVYSNTVFISKNAGEPDFGRIIEEMSAESGFEGEVVEVSNDLVKVYSPLNHLVNSQSGFELFNYDIKNKTAGSSFIIRKNHLANGRLTGFSGKLAILRIDKVGDSSVKIGDCVNIRP